jgi:hypothetical protein
MPNIIDLTYFQNPNVLNIPLSVSAPVANASMQTPNETTYLTDLITRVEKSILVNALGLSTYNTLQLALADEFANPIYASYEKLVKGEEYDDKVWNGLDYELSLIAFKVYEVFLTETNTRLSGVGTVQGKSEKSVNVSPLYKVANASQSFLKGYQNGYLPYPNVYDIDGVEFIDYFGCNEDVEISLYQYLVDKQADFENFDLTKFRTYEGQNSFGI